MNLDSSPTREDLKLLIQSQDDNAGHHVLWVDSAAEVHISTVPANLTPVGFQLSEPTMKLRLETFQCGNDYVGPNAAQDDELVDRLYNALIQNWPNAKNSKDVVYKDTF